MSKYDSLCSRLADCFAYAPTTLSGNDYSLYEPREQSRDSHVPTICNVDQLFPHPRAVVNNLKNTGGGTQVKMKLLIVLGFLVVSLNLCFAKRCRFSPDVWCSSQAIAEQCGVCIFIH